MKRMKRGGREKGERERERRRRRKRSDREERKIKRKKRGGKKERGLWVRGAVIGWSGRLGRCLVVSHPYQYRERTHRTSFLYTQKESHGSLTQALPDRQTPCGSSSRLRICGWDIRSSVISTPLCQPLAWVASTESVRRVTCLMNTA